MIVYCSNCKRVLISADKLLRPVLKYEHFFYCGDCIVDKCKEAGVGVKIEFKKYDTIEHFNLENPVQ